MAYDRYDTRRDWRGERPRWQDDDRSERGWHSDRGDRNDRGFFERAGDEIASWFGDDEAERRRRRDTERFGDSDRYGSDRDRFAGHLKNEGDVRDYYGRRGDREQGRDFGRGRDRAFMSDEDFSRYERRPSFRDEGYRRPYTGRPTGRSDFGGGGDRGDQGYRPMTGDYGRGFDDRLERGGGSFYGVGAHHDRHYGEWRSRQINELDRDYEDYAMENRSRFEDDFTNWRGQRQQKRGLLGQVREHMEVLGSDGEHVGTVDRTAGDRLILTKSDEASGGAHHSLMCTMIDRVEGNQVFLDKPAEEAKKHWRDDSRERALFERDDQGEAGPGTLNRSFSGTY
jgi:hypothetical protein